MTYEDIRDKWLKIATPNKRITKRSPNGRQHLGNKGIGRFSAEYLAKDIEIISYPKNKNQKIHFKIDWNDYRIDLDKNVDEVPIFVYVEDLENISQQGVELVLSDLRQDWNENEIDRLRNELGIMILPNESINFKINLNYSGEEEEIESSFPYYAEITMEGEVSILENEITIYYEILPYNNESYSKNKVLQGSLHCGEFTFSIQFIDLSRKKRFRDMDAIYAKDVRALLREYGGMKIYYDNFRIMSYGDSKNDWLGLDKRRISRFGDLIPSNQQFFGFINLNSQKNDQIQITSNRESLVENLAFDDLKKVTMKIFDFFAEERQSKRLKEIDVEKLELDKVIQKYSSPEKNQLEEYDPISSTPNKETLKSLFDILEKQSKITKLSHDEFDKQESEISNLLKVTEKATYDIYAKQDELNRLYRQLSTIGMTLSSYVHELKNPNASINRILRTIQDMLKTEEIPDDLINPLKILIKEYKYISNYIIKISELNILQTQKERTNINIISSLTEFKNDFIEMYDRLNVHFDIIDNTSKLKMVLMNQVDLISVWLNLFTNAFYYIKDLEDNERRIKVYVDNEGKFINVYYNDNGPGIDKSLVKRKQTSKIFEPFFSTKKLSFSDEEYEIQGTGLGLFIIDEIMSEINGDISVILDKSKYDFLNGAVFKLTFRSS